MAQAVIMPKAGITVESCLIGSWNKKVGDPVKEGDILFTYETDKTVFECESTASGTLLAVFYSDGDEVPCLEPVCVIGEKGEDFEALRPASAASSEAPEKPAQAEEKPGRADGKPEERGKAAFEPAPAAESRGVSPRARKLAEQSGTDLKGAVPSGPNGRVIERDVRELMRSGEKAAAAEPAAAPAVPAEAKAAEPEYDEIRFNGIRRTISRNMKESLLNSAQLTHQFSFDASALLALRQWLKEAGGPAAGITVGDMVLYGVAQTLLTCPDLNACMPDDITIRRYRHVNLSVAVDTPRGLIVPVIPHAETLSLEELSRKVKELAAAARDGSLSPDQLSGGSITVSNLGGFGVESFTPVLNPPQTGIIGVCKTVDRPRRAKDGSLELYPAMTLSLTYDHRAIDGAPASRYMQTLCRTLEQFPRLLVR
ncbi:MAG: 2-oxo acid dehydrogenase subunit E2 [Lachnospiraceae bacterium]|nr:2-oxo acid dehydrogenase subunit E2 [Lachnospiraceae bacterium]